MRVCVWGCVCVGGAGACERPYRESSRWRSRRSIPGLDRIGIWARCRCPWTRWGSALRERCRPRWDASATGTGYASPASPSPTRSSSARRRVGVGATSRLTRTGPSTAARLRPEDCAAATPDKRTHTMHRLHTPCRQASRPALLSSPPALRRPAAALRTWAALCLALCCAAGEGNLFAPGFRPLQPPTGRSRPDASARLGAGSAAALPRNVTVAY